MGRKRTYVLTEKTRIPGVGTLIKITRKKIVQLLLLTLVRKFYGHSAFYIVRRTPFCQEPNVVVVRTSYCEDPLNLFHVDILSVSWHSGVPRDIIINSLCELPNFYCEKGFVKEWRDVK